VTMAWYELFTGVLAQKRQFRADMARIKALPAPYGEAAMGVFRYLMHSAGISDGQTSVTMITDLADLWERAAADGTPVRDIVGDDPVEFAETFAAAYSGKNWIDKERRRLVQTIDDAERDEPR
jgi:DNA-binding ferritin-like protein (Dps family)